jgi:hypothetical protein
MDTNSATSTYSSRSHSVADRDRQRFEMVLELVNVFRLERTVYLIITSASVLVLLGCALFLMLARQGMETAVLAMLGSSGGIIYSSGRLLRMFSEAIRVIQPIRPREK